MDTDDLDQWLDEQGSPPTTADPWGETASAEGLRATSRRPPWRGVALIGVAVWALVIGVVVIGGPDEPSSTADAIPTADEPDMLVAGTPDVGVASAPPLPDADMATQPTAGEGDVAPPGSGEVPPEGATTTWPAQAEAAAVLALRTLLTVPGERTTYLEWATPVDGLALDAGIWLMVMEAIWLEGDDGDLTTVRSGRWAVPIADDGQALSAPWPLAVPDPPPALDLGLPTGTDGLEAVMQALTDAGWTSQTVIAADPHPLLVGGYVALVDGVSPLTTPVQGVLVWVAPDADGVLRVLGDRR